MAELPVHAAFAEEIVVVRPVAQHPLDPLPPELANLILKAVAQLEPAADVPSGGQGALEGAPVVALPESARPQTALDQHPCSSLRLSCRESRKQHDQCITTVCLDLQASNVEAARHDDDPRCSAPKPGDAPRIDWTPMEWERRQRAEFEARMAFLFRLPSLTSLSLWQWESEAALAFALWRCSGATGGRLRQLTLGGAAAPLTRAAMQNVLAAFPGLQALHLGMARQQQRGSTFNRSLEVKGPLLGVLHGGSLVKLVLEGELSLEDSSLRSLAGMATLQHLSIHLGQAGGSAEQRDLRALGRGPPPAELPSVLALTGLVNLRHFELRFATHVDDPWAERPSYKDTVGRTGSLSQVAHLFDATQLTSLLLRRVLYAAAGAAPPHAAAAAAAAALASSRVFRRHSTQSQLDLDALAGAAKERAALDRLGALANLQVLDLGHFFMVDSAAMAALRRLLLLTELHVGGMHLPPPPVGQGAQPAELPHLQVLGLRQPQWRPADLLRSLAPLLPLPSLVTLEASRSRPFHVGLLAPPCHLHHILADPSEGLVLDLGHGKGEAREAAAALQGLVAALVAAPWLQLPSTLTLAGTNTPPQAGLAHFGPLQVGAAQLARDLYDQFGLPQVGAAQMALDEVVSSAAPLAGRFSRVQLRDVGLQGVAWDAFSAAFSGLEDLEVLGCDFDGRDIVGLIEGLPGLKQLSLASDLAEGSWAEVARARCDGLRVQVRSRHWCDEASVVRLVQRCEAERASVPGLGRMTWGMWKAGYDVWERQCGRQV